MEPTLRTINAVISALFFICYTYQFLYIPLVLLKKRRPLPCPAASHRYAVLIAARNEENVIAGLLDSLAHRSRRLPGAPRYSRSWKRPCRIPSRR